MESEDRGLCAEEKRCVRCKVLIKRWECEIYGNLHDAMPVLYEKFGSKNEFCQDFEEKKMRILDAYILPNKQKKEEILSEDT